MSYELKEGSSTRASFQDSVDKTLQILCEHSNNAKSVVLSKNSIRSDATAILGKITDVHVQLESARQGLSLTTNKEYQELIAKQELDERSTTTRAKLRSAMHVRPIILFANTS